MMGQVQTRVMGEKLGSEQLRTGLMEVNAQLVTEVLKHNVNIHLTELKYKECFLCAVCFGTQL